MSIEILLGTYTRRVSDGIYSVDLNKTSKTIDNLTLVAEVGSPTYLDTIQDKNIIITIVNENEQGGIASLVKQEDGSYKRQSVMLADGASPAYVKYDESRNFVYTSNYHKGEAAVYSVDPQGNLDLLDTVRHSGSSTHENQQSPHVHYSDLTPDEKYLVVCDLGTDELYTYEVSDAGKLEEISRLTVKAGSGPRHLVFHPTLDIAYLFAELSSEIIVLDYNTETGGFSEIQTLSTIPEDHTSFNAGAAIRISNDGQFLYASNRGHDSLAVYSTNDNGKLTLVEYVSTEGETPRDFDLDPSNKFVVVGHQDSDNLTLFERNPDNGKLELLQKDFYAPEVVNVSM